MRRPMLPVAALILALSGGAALAAAEKPAQPTQPTQAKSPAKAAPKAPAGNPGSADAKQPKTEIKSIGIPTVKETQQTPEQIKAQQAEWKKIDDQQASERKERRERYKAVRAEFAKEGIKFKKASKPDTYRVYAPAVAQTTDPAQRKAAAKALVTRLKGQLEPIFKKKLTFEIYTDDKVTQRVTF